MPLYPFRCWRRPALKLPSLPRDLLLSPAAVFEDLRFEAARPVAEHDVSLAFTIERAGELRGLALHVELFVFDGEAAEPEVSSAQPDSHWPNVFLMLPEPIEVTLGQQVGVRATAHLAAAQPRYTFEVRLDGELLGSMEYPENL